MTAQADPTSRLAVGAIVRRGSEILLVAEAASDADEPVWALPGGVVEPGEPVGHALIRKVELETGLVGFRVGPLLWVARYEVGGATWEAYGFEVDASEPDASEPDGAEQSPAAAEESPAAESPAEESPAEETPAEKGPARVAWVPIAEAIHRLSGMWFPPIREPAVQYLTGRAAVATFWAWPRLDQPPEVVPVPTRQRET